MRRLTVQLPPGALAPEGPSDDDLADAYRWGTCGLCRSTGRLHHAYTVPAVCSPCLRVIEARWLFTRFPVYA